MTNSSSDYKLALWQKHPGIFGGTETVYGHRIERWRLRRLKQSYSIQEISNMYPQIEISNIEQA